MEFTVKRGETLTILLDDMDGIEPDVSAVTASLRPGIPSRRTVDPDAEPVADFAVVDRAAEGSDPAGWGLTLDAATTAAIAIGYYMVDARLVMDGGTEIVTDPLAIRVTEPATLRS